MKKIIFMLFLLLGVFPTLEKGELIICGTNEARAQIYGGELNEVVVTAPRFEPEMAPIKEFGPSMEVEPEPVNLNEPFLTEYIGGEHFGEVSPDQNKTEKEKDPCENSAKLSEDLKAQITDPLISNKLNQVLASLKSTNAQAETGFAIYKTPSGSNIAGPLITGSTTEPKISIGFTTSDPDYKPSAILHGHIHGVYANPSGGDIYGLAEAFTAATITTSYVPAADGTMYAMVIDDPKALSSFLSAYPASENQSGDNFKPKSPMYYLYKKAYDSFLMSGLSDKIAEERANAVIMSEAGINLLKAPKNSTDFKEIYGTKVTDSQGNINFVKSDCP